MITLTTIVLNDAEDPYDELVLDRMATYSRRPTTPGRVQPVGGGGFRVIRSDEGEQAVWDLTAYRCPLETTDWIESHAARTLCLRDDQGRKLFVVYFDPRIEEVPRPRSANVELQLTETTWVEAIR